MKNDPQQEAITRGLTTYCDGEHCSMGHNSDRFVRSGNCVLCVSENLPEDHPDYTAPRKKPLASHYSPINGRRRSEPQTEVRWLESIARHQFSYFSKATRQAQTVKEWSFRYSNKFEGDTYTGPVNQEFKFKE